MTKDDHDRLTKLCAQIESEKDNVKCLALIKELNSILDIKRADFENDPSNLLSETSCLGNS